jgi:hypothetical protein
MLPRMHIYRSRRASRSDSRRQRMSSSRTVFGHKSAFAILDILTLDPSWKVRGFSRIIVPGPLTFRMIDRVWSSMNSTRTWVTPPREPIQPSQKFIHLLQSSHGEFCDIFLRPYQTSWGDNAPVRPRTRVTLTSLTGCLEASIVAT